MSSCPFIAFTGQTDPHSDAHRVTQGPTAGLFFCQRIAPGVRRASRASSRRGSKENKRFPREGGVRYGLKPTGPGDSIFGIVGLQVGATGEHPTLHTSTDSEEFWGPTVDSDGARPK